MPRIEQYNIAPCFIYIMPWCSLQYFDDARAPFDARFPRRLRFNLFYRNFLTFAWRAYADCQSFRPEVTPASASQLFQGFVPPRRYEAAASFSAWFCRPSRLLRWADAKDWLLRDVRAEDDYFRCGRCTSYARRDIWDDIGLMRAFVRGGVEKYKNIAAWSEGRGASGDVYSPLKHI